MKNALIFISVIILALVISGLLTGCASVPIAHSKSELRVIMFVKSGENQTQIEETVNRVSDHMGIKLRIIGWEKRCLNPLMSTKAIMGQMYRQIPPSDKWDVCVAWVGSPIHTLLLFAFFPIPIVAGSTDTTFRRYVVIRNRSDYVLQHELSHVLGATHKQISPMVMLP